MNWKKILKIIVLGSVLDGTKVQYKAILRRSPQNPTQVYSVDLFLGKKIHKIALLETNP